MSSRSTRPRRPHQRVASGLRLSEVPIADAVQRIHTRNGIPIAEIYPLPLEV